MQAISLVLLELLELLFLLGAKIEVGEGLSEIGQGRAGQGKTSDAHNLTVLTTFPDLLIIVTVSVT
jgi:hypothetical protein